MDDSHKEVQFLLTYLELWKSDQVTSIQDEVAVRGRVYEKLRGLSIQPSDPYFSHTISSGIVEGYILKTYADNGSTDNLALTRETGNRTFLEWLVDLEFCVGDFFRNISRTRVRKGPIEDLTLTESGADLLWDLLSTEDKLSYITHYLDEDSKL